MSENLCVSVRVLPGSRHTLVLVGEAGQVLGDSGSGLRPGVVELIVLWTVFCLSRDQNREDQ